MRGGRIPEHFTLALSKREGDTLLNLAIVLRSAAKDGHFALQENEDELLEELIARLDS